jgi:RNA polymerase sigma factor (sigma-70 family)
MTAIDASTQVDSPPDWATALAEHGRWLRIVVSARLGERQAVDEVMQEISLAAIEQRTPLADPSKVAAWLYRLAVLKVLMYRRQRGRQSKLFGRYAERVRDQSPPTDGDPLGWLLSAERTEAVRTAIARLPRRDAEILLLKYSESWSYADLARHLGRSPAAIESHLHRARQRLRDEINRHSTFCDS